MSLPKDKSSSVLVATATVTGPENWRAVRSRCRVRSANASAHPPEVGRGTTSIYYFAACLAFGLAAAPPNWCGRSPTTVDLLASDQMELSAGRQEAPRWRNPRRPVPLGVPTRKSLTLSPWERSEIPPSGGCSESVLRLRSRTTTRSSATPRTAQEPPLRAGAHPKPTNYFLLVGWSRSRP